MAVNLKDVVQVTGERGVFQIKKTLRNGLLLESIDKEKRRLMKSTRAMKVFSLDSTFICTTSDVQGLPVATFFELLYNKYADQLPISSSDDEALAKFMREEVADYDEQRLQPSKIAKLIQWYKAIREHLPALFGAQGSELESTK